MILDKLIKLVNNKWNVGILLTIVFLVLTISIFPEKKVFLAEITGEIDQQEQILKASLEKYQSLIESQADEIYEELKNSIFDDSDQLIMDIVKFFRLFSRNQWKRERYALSFHVDDHNLDPRTWCRTPILTGGYEEEIDELMEYLSDEAKIKLGIATKKDEEPIERIPQPGEAFITNINWTATQGNGTRAGIATRRPVAVPVAHVEAFEMDEVIEDEEPNPLRH